jgi:hypothetical protein
VGSREKQSPLKTVPRRAAGQSLQELIEKRHDAVLDYLVFGVLALAFFLWELFRWIAPSPPRPLVVGIICLLLLLWSIYRIACLRLALRRLKQGRDGERIVGEKLENLRVMGYRVFHDLVGGGFNVDHVLVGPAGIFAIETKTWSKAKHDAIESDGEMLWKSGTRLHPNPIDQAKAQARWLHGLVKELTGQSFFVVPLVVFPGWWVKCKVAQPKTVVLNPDQLEAYLKALPIRLEAKDIGFIANRLEFLVRKDLD